MTTVMIILILLLWVVSYTCCVMRYERKKRKPYTKETLLDEMSKIAGKHTMWEGEEK